MSIHNKNKMVKQIKKLVHEDGCVTICDFSEAGISFGTC